MDILLSLGCGGLVALMVQYSGRLQAGREELRTGRGIDKLPGLSYIYLSCGVKQQ